MSMADRISIREVVEGLLKTKHRHFSYHQPLPLSRIQHPLEGGIRIPFREGGKSVFRQFKSVVLSPRQEPFSSFDAYTLSYSEVFTFTTRTVLYLP